MNFEEKINSIIQRLPSLSRHLETEEATKNALIMPFIAALGYDIFNPLEVIPEYTTDVGTKKGEKIDYAIMREGETIILVECKKAGTELTNANLNQLYRYFGVSKARIALLTNGIQYRFYSDLEDKNKMDQRPFLELDLSAPRQSAIKEIKKMTKESFDLNLMLSTANELKYVSAIKQVLEKEYEDPDENFVRLCFKSILPDGIFTAQTKEQWQPMVHKAFQLFLSEQVNNRLRSALEKETGESKSSESDTQKEKAQDKSEKGIITTKEEKEGYNIVRAILARDIDPERVFPRDTKSYFGIILDDSNRKPICRLHFNAISQKYLGVFDAKKQETRIPIEKVSDIYKHAEALLQALTLYRK